MAWYMSVIPIPPEVWSLVSWTAFFFKLVSLAFALPIFGLIVFDLCLWVWRLNRPPPRDVPQQHGTAKSKSRESASLAPAPPDGRPSNSTSVSTKASTAAGGKRSGYYLEVDG
ncbi:hypothetical protein JX265_000906 [Neoarthrinium moseri]|uniref:Uncharacterized protein n=1 Tax=Neoarthrinium moseri TaxID=1658444 RepID=A0A9P9WWT6_9PEZI|nr:uncharacterized protein JN550_006988 [Neoarthrinium moseri]KAI1847668.1 hypothetical protein JX266_006520 [Neoarthrinium moseri]KAI1867257.1 hypothetical protein JN550_006988 [Neoarthrinium moseri]KAI1880666.1 hypothetical protein JX265_000906 [Neoarthrinium moseri]